MICQRATSGTYSANNPNVIIHKATLTNDSSWASKAQELKNICMPEIVTKSAFISIEN